MCYFRGILSFYKSVIVFNAYQSWLTTANVYDLRPIWRELCGLRTVTIMHNIQFTMLSCQVMVFLPVLFNCDTVVYLYVIFDDSYRIWNLHHCQKNIHINLCYIGIQEICSPGDPEKDVTLHFYLSVEKEYETTECCVLFN